MELENTKFYNRKINETFDEFQTAYISNEMKSQLASDAESDQSKKQIFQMWRSEPVRYYQSTTERANIVSPLIPLNDSDFFRNGKIPILFRIKPNLCTLLNLFPSRTNR